MGKLDFPATGRNAAPILEVLTRVLPPEGSLLEIASGSGQHAAHFAPRFPGLRWQPTDLEPEHLRSIEAWTAEIPNVEAPRQLDVVETWSVQGPYDAMFCANMIHIAPWEATLGLLEGAGGRLRNAAPLVLYGPFQRAGRHTAPSNEAFDTSLRRRDARWGVRDLDVVREHASRHGLDLDEVVQMPANNLTVVFRRR
jgi:hypothetical protein